MIIAEKPHSVYIATVLYIPLGSRNSKQKSYDISVILGCFLDPWTAWENFIDL